MIGYPIARTNLEQRIREQKADWLNRAKERTEEFRRLGRYQEKSSIWSEVKAVYMRLQGGSKCAYCERKLESEDLGKVEQDVEHFRPKGNVKSWKPSKRLLDLGVKVTAAPNEKRGYFLLPYHLFNYAAACKPCNSVLKGDRFPISGKYNLTGENPQKLKSEKPYLIYPIGDFDDAPERLIRFHGVSPQPTASRGHRRHRALVTIEFFALDDVNRRKNLLLERARLIIALQGLLEKLNSNASATEKQKAQALIDAFTEPTTPHTNCARSFKELFGANLAEARSVADHAFNLLVTVS